MKNETKANIDLLGICTSVLCMLHCLAIPLLIVLGLDSVLRVVDQEWIEMGILLASLTIGALAFYRGYSRHKRIFIPFTFLVGFLLIANGESVSPEWAGLTLSVFGACIIAFAHIQNMRWMRIGASTR